MTEEHLASLKKEYQQALKELEQNEFELQKFQDILKKSVTRLAIAAKGVEAKMDPLLEEIKLSVRNRIDIARLDQLLGKLFDIMNEIDEQAAPQKTDGQAGFYSLLASALQESNWAGSAIEIQQSLQAFIDKMPDDTQLAQKLIDIIHHLGAEKSRLAEKTASGVEPLQAFIHKLASLLAQTAPDFGNTRLLQQELNRLYEHLQEKLHASENSIAEMLRSLVDKLELPASLSKQKQQLVRQLAESKIKPAQWNRILKQVADLSNQALLKLQQEKRDLQQFIEKITLQLTDIEKFVKQTRADRKISSSETDKLHHQVNSSVNHIHQEVDKAEDINLLKNNIQQHLNSIKENFKKFKLAEQVREQEAEKRHLEIARDLQKSRQETERLKKQLKISKMQLYKDVLTGIPNRLAYQERVELEFLRHQRNKTPLSLAIWDIDYFKRVNDRFGHDAGDRVLQMFARLIQAKLRKTDFFARIGGEEFVLLMPDTDSRGAMQVCEKLRQMIENSGFNYKGKAFPITASVGIASFQQDSAEQVFKRADTALYQSKNQGRNRCTLAQ